MTGFCKGTADHSNYRLYVKRCSMLIMRLGRGDNAEHSLIKNAIFFLPMWSLYSDESFVCLRYLRKKNRWVSNNRLSMLLITYLLLVNRLMICLSINRRCEPLGYERTHVIISGVMGPIGSAFPLFFSCLLVFLSG